MTIKLYGNHLVALNLDETNTPKVITTSYENRARVFNSKEDAQHTLAVLSSLGYNATLS